MFAARKLLAAVFAILLVLALAACDFIAPPKPTPTAKPTAAPTEPPAETPSPAPASTPTLTPTPESTPTPQAVDHAGGGILFDIYQSGAQADINKDGTDEDIQFTAGASKSTLTIDGTSYDVPKPNLAQLFAVTDIDTSDKNLELVFTDKYDAGLADSEKAFSWMYWWNGSKLLLMGGLMDVKFDGAWRSSFKAADVTDGNGQVMCLTRSQELTDVWYVAWYHTSGSGRKLYEWRHTAGPVGETGELTCKTVCLLQTNHDEVNNERDKPVYMSSEYDYYWIPTLEPTTLGRVLNPDEGIKIIAQPGEKLTIVGAYGPTWFKVKTHDGYTGWIYCKDGHVGAYNATMGWTAEDMFDGLVSAG